MNDRPIFYLVRFGDAYGKPCYQYQYKMTCRNRAEFFFENYHRDSAGDSFVCLGGSDDREGGYFVASHSIFSGVDAAVCLQI